MVNGANLVDTDEVVEAVVAVVAEVVEEYVVV